MFRYFSLARTSQRPLGAVPDVGKGGTRRIPGSICCAGLGRSSRSVAPSCLIHWFFSFFSGGRGASKALGRVLLEQKVERQTCQRAALRELFEVENPYREFLTKKHHHMLQQGSTHRRRWLCRATRSARLLRSASAAFASAASIVATNASATLPTLGLMIRWPEFCCQKSPTITCKYNKLVTVQTFDFHLKHAGT